MSSPTQRGDLGKRPDRTGTVGHFGRRLKELRQVAGLSQPELAGRLGIRTLPNEHMRESACIRGES